MTFDDIKTEIKPRFKIQVYNNTNTSWSDIQLNYDTLEGARVAYKKIAEHKRIIKIVGKERSVAEENLCNHVMRPAYIKTISGKKTISFCSLDCGYIVV